MRASQRALRRVTAAFEEMRVPTTETEANALVVGLRQALNRGRPPQGRTAEHERLRLALSALGERIVCGAPGLSSLIILTFVGSVAC